MSCVEKIAKVYKDALEDFKANASDTAFASNDLIKTAMLHDINIGIDTVTSLLNKNDVLESMVVLLKEDERETTSSVANTIFESSLANSNSSHPLAGKLNIKPTALNAVNLDDNTDGVSNLDELTKLLADDGMTEKLIAKVKSTFKEIAKNTNVVNNKDDYLGVSLLVDKEGNITTNAACARELLESGSAFTYSYMYACRYE
jgi:hypothetical protein